MKFHGNILYSDIYTIFLRETVVREVFPPLSKKHNFESVYFQSKLFLCQISEITEKFAINIVQRYEEDGFFDFLRNFSPEIGEIGAHLNILNLPPQICFMWL